MAEPRDVSRRQEGFFFFGRRQRRTKAEERRMSYNRDSSNNDSKVYVGNLPQDIRVRDLEDVFYKYGKIVDVDLHTNTGGRGGGERSGAPFAFVEFEDPR